MKKLSLTLATAIIFCSISHAQNFWLAGTPPNSIYYNSGNVGIGTTSPGSSTLLQVNGRGLFTNGLSDPNDGSPKGTAIGFDQTGNYGFIRALQTGTTNYPLFLGNGNVGIGTTTPSQKLVSTGSILDVGITGANNGISYTSFSDGLYSALNAATPTEGVGIWSDNQGNASVGALYDNAASSLNLVLRGSTSTHGFIAVKINGSGNVGIGTISPDAKLAVEGTIHTQEVKVDMTGWSDYVFNQDYNLPKLSEVKTYINKNHHLPGIPAETEVVENGIKLTEILKLQQKKIEELTLYLIDQQSTNQSLQKQINQLKAKSSH